MAKRTKEEIQERIEGCEWRLDNLQRQEKVLLKKEKELERNARTHRLIERGAMLESHLVKPLILSNEQVKTILDKVFATRVAELMVEEMVSRVEKECSGEI